VAGIFQLSSGFRDAIGSRRVILPRDDDWGADVLGKLLNARVICRDN